MRAYLIVFQYIKFTALFIICNYKLFDPDDSNSCGRLTRMSTKSPTSDVDKLCRPQIALLYTIFVFYGLVHRANRLADYSNVADVSVFTDYVKSVCDNYICVETTVFETIDLQFTLHIQWKMASLRIYKRLRTCLPFRYLRVSYTADNMMQLDIYTYRPLVNDILQYYIFIWDFFAGNTKLFQWGQFTRLFISA